MRSWIPSLILVVVGLSLPMSVAYGQGGRGNQPPPGVIVLPGFNHQRVYTADSSTGRIWQDQGLEIRYEGGLGTANRVQRAAGSLLWSKEMTRGNQQIQIGMTKDRTLLVNFSLINPPRPGFVQPFNFYAQVRNEEDVATVLLMVLGFQH